MGDHKLGCLDMPTCEHEKHQVYTQKRFDILGGLEFTLTRCVNCHKIVGMQARKSSKR